MAVRKVIVLKVRDYDAALLSKKVARALDEYFDLSSFLRENDRILLKPNLLIPVSPEAAITTHPAFIEAVGNVFKAKGFRVGIADNPSAVVTLQNVEDVYKGCGVTEVAARCGFDLFFPEKSYKIDDIPVSWWTKGFKMVNLPKLKTHNLTMITCAAKNLYGCIAGMHKINLHREHPKTADFMPVLLRLYELIKPSLHIVDAVVSLEGEGPAKGGEPKATGFVVIGEDALCVDYAVSKMIGLDIEKNPLLAYARRQGAFNPRQVEIISEFERPVTDFKLPSFYKLNNVPPRILTALGALLTVRPRILKSKCTGCGDCVRACPNAAITKPEGKAVIDYSLCIRCLCCNEVCRFGAVAVTQSVVLRLFICLKNLQDKLTGKP